MHWAAHRHTTAEVIYERADSEKENMGLTSWEHDEIRRSDVDVAKNYLTETIVMPAKYLESTSFFEYTLLP